MITEILLCGGGCTIIKPTPAVSRQALKMYEHSKAIKMLYNTKFNIEKGRKVESNGKEKNPTQNRNIDQKNKYLE